MALETLLQQFDDEAVGVGDFAHIADIAELNGVRHIQALIVEAQKIDGLHQGRAG